VKRADYLRNAKLLGANQEVVMSDVSLRQNIIDELEFEPSLNAANIGVAVENGVVTLTGHVRSYMEKVRAERVVQRVKDVHGVAEELEVRYPSDKKTADDEIAKRALNIISWDTSIPADKVQVKVEGGWITLSGQVEWYYQKVSAESAVRRISGVKGVSNMLTIEPRVQPSDIKGRIENALKRKAGVEASKIRVSVSDGKVTLDGNVNAWFERTAAEDAAWAAPGVTSVVDHIHIA
jgi:osmotically-inducible protein OsmY